jgi:gentisate 1,2-dioxygenase
LSTRSHRGTPLLAYRWEHTDAALNEQLACEDEGVQGATLEPGHAAIRFVNPANGRDALSTIRTEMHRLRAGVTTTVTRTVGSSVWQVFDGGGTVSVGRHTFTVVRGDLVAVPTWQPLHWRADTELSLFRFGDEPVYAALGLDGSHTAGQR